MTQNERNLLHRCQAFALQAIDDCGPCDHKVNVCVCDYIKLADDIENALKNKPASFEGVRQ